MLELQRDGGGYRDYLDGRPVTCGSLLFFRWGGVWLQAVYEADLSGNGCPATLRDGAGQTVGIDRNKTRLRWPTSAEYEAQRAAERAREERDADL